MLNVPNFHHQNVQRKNMKGMGVSFFYPFFCGAIKRKENT